VIAARGRLGLVVVNYGSHRLLEANLAPLDLPGTVQVVVVDNPTDDAEREAVTALARRRSWTLVLPERNAGFGPGANAGAARAIADGCDVVVFVNPDAEVTVSLLLELSADVRARPSTMVAPLIDRGDGRRWFSRGVLDPRTGQVAEDYFMYWEDVDLGQRCLAAGATLAVRDDLVAVHHVGGTQGDRKSHLYFRYNCRNRLVFAARHLERADVLRWLVATPRASWEILCRDGRRRVLIDPAATRAALVGTLAGVRVALASLLVHRAGR